MNRERILELADVIEGHKIPGLGFNMALWVDESDSDYPDKSGHNCGTVACIGGTANYLWNHRVGDIAAARCSLDLGEDDAEELFYARRGPALERITLPQAVRCLRHLAETGVVDWEWACSEEHDQ